MNNAVARIEPRAAAMTERAVDNYGERSLTAADIRAQVNLIQDVMHAVMYDGTHYGKIPGTQTVSLLKPGAEKIMATFRLSARPVVEDLSDHDCARYRVTCYIDAPNGRCIGGGVGECSSNEEKYKWRKPVCDPEFNETPEDRRRTKWAKGQGGSTYQQKQVRVNHADIANTVLKMAKKRALIDAVLTATAASDVFTQDIEDLPEEYREQVGDDARSRARPGTQAVQRTIPEDSPERDRLIAEVRAVADLGSVELGKKWEAIGKQSRQLIADKLSEFKERAGAVDKAASATEGAQP